MLYAALGDLLFDASNAWDGISRRSGASFAEHARIEQKPRLQWTGQALEEITLDFVLHMTFCDPDTEVKAWRDAQAAHKALPLSFGNGAYLGYFVITSLDETARHTDPTGSTVACELRVDLREAPEDGQVPPAPLAVGPSTPPLTATASAARSSSAPVGVLVSAASNTQAAARQAGDNVALAQGVAAINPAAAMSKIAAIVSDVKRLGTASGALQAAAVIASGVPGIAQVTASAVQAVAASNSIRIALGGVNSGNVVAQLGYAANKIESINGALRTSAGPLAALSAQIATRRG